MGPLLVSSGDLHTPRGQERLARASMGPLLVSSGDEPRPSIRTRNLLSLQWGRCW